MVSSEISNPAKFGPADLAARVDVSRETLQRLEIYEALLQKWSPKINLVSRKSLDQAWYRHIYDSVQVADHIPDTARTLLDVGSGGGFPGLVLAILRPGLNVTLVDSDKRKCIFMREVARECGLSIRVKDQRIEDLEIAPVDVITARALAPMAQLIELTHKFTHERTISLFLKGQDVDKELTSAAKYWKIDPVVAPSQTDPAARIVILQGRMEKI